MLCIAETLTCVAAVWSPAHYKSLGWIVLESQERLKERVTFVKYEWKLKDSHTVVSQGAVTSCVQCDSNWQMECPAIVFVVFRTKEKETYSIVKMCTNYEFGVQSQCLVKETHDSQRNVAM